MISISRKIAVEGQMRRTKIADTRKPFNLKFLKSDSTWAFSASFIKVAVNCQLEDELQDPVSEKRTQFVAVVDAENVKII